MLARLLEGLKFSGLAMSMVFLVLAILGGTIELFRLLLHRPGGEGKAGQGRQAGAAGPGSDAVPSAELRAPSAVQGAVPSAELRAPSAVQGAVPSAELRAPSAVQGAVRVAAAPAAAGRPHDGGTAAGDGDKRALVAAIAAAFHQMQERPLPAAAEGRAGGPADFWRMRSRRSGVGMIKRNRRWSNG